MHALIRASLSIGCRCSSTWRCGCSCRDSSVQCQPPCPGSCAGGAQEHKHVRLDHVETSSQSSVKVLNCVVCVTRCSTPTTSTRHARPRHAAGSKPKNWCLWLHFSIHILWMPNAKLVFDIRRSVLFVSRFFQSCILYPCMFVSHFPVLHVHVSHFQHPQTDDTNATTKPWAKTAFEDTSTLKQNK